jgi:hypothetical protein
MSGYIVLMAPDAGDFDGVSPFTAFLLRVHRIDSSSEQCVDIGRTHDGSVTHEGLVVVLDAVMVVEIVDHDAEGFLDRTRCGVAEPIDPFEPCAVAEMKARYRVDTASG